MNLQISQENSVMQFSLSVHAITHENDVVCRYLLADDDSSFSLEDLASFFLRGFKINFSYLNEAVHTCRRVFCRPIQFVILASESV
jgi:hypothetical protein